MKEAKHGVALPEVRILVAGINHNITTGRFGDYYRLLLPGNYSITATAAGWVLLSETRCNVSLPPRAFEAALARE